MQRNLRSPLTGITHAAARLGLAVPEVRVAVRSGDTPPAERRTLARTPPDILITTPESLFLLLTSRARAVLAGVHTVVLDAVPVLAGSMGAHLALNLERLDAGGVGHSGSSCRDRRRCPRWPAGSAGKAGGV